MSNRSTTRSGRRPAGGIVAVAVALLGACAVLSLSGPTPSARADSGGGQPVTVTVPEHSMPPVQPAGLTCSGTGGGALGDNPTLHPGDQLSCTGTGFTGGEQVTASLGSAGSLGAVAAGPDGTAHLDISLPANLGAGRQTLIFSGRTSGRSATFSFTVTIVATLPVGGGGGGGSGASSRGGAGALAKTGLDVAGVAGAGLVLTAVGVLARLAGRRRGASPPGEGRR